MFSVVMHPVGLSGSQMFVAHVAYYPRGGHVLRLNVVNNVWLLTADVTTLATLELIGYIFEVQCLNCSIQVLKRP